MTTPNKCNDCDNIATIQISYCTLGGLEKAEHFNYYCNICFLKDTKNYKVPYPCFVTDLGEQT
jgi:hypothetical protein